MWYGTLLPKKYSKPTPPLREKILSGQDKFFKLFISVAAKQQDLGLEKLPPRGEEPVAGASLLAPEAIILATDVDAAVGE